MVFGCELCPVGKWEICGLSVDNPCGIPNCFEEPGEKKTKNIHPIAISNIEIKKKL